MRGDQGMQLTFKSREFLIEQIFVHTSKKMCMIFLACIMILKIAIILDYHYQLVDRKKGCLFFLKREFINVFKGGKQNQSRE